MPADSLYARIVDGDEDALREAWREHGPIARDLARRIAGPTQAAALVEEVLLLIWADPKRWAGEPLDLHLLRLVRDLALIARRRGLGPRQAARELEPPPIRSDPATAQIAEGLDYELAQRIMIQLSDAERTALEAAWFDGLSPTQIAGLLESGEDSALAALDAGLDRFANLIRDLQ